MKPLTKRVVQQLLLKTKQSELEAQLSGKLLRCDDYLTLANTFLLEQNSDKAEEVLRSYLCQTSTIPADTQLVIQKIQQIHIEKLQEITRCSNINSSVNHCEQKYQKHLSIRQQALHDSPYSIPESPTTEEVLALPLNTQDLVFICSAYTGESVQDELFEMSIQRIEYCQNNDCIVRVKDSYHGFRQPSVEIPSSVRLRFAIGNQSIENCQLDDAKITSITQNVHSVISHNHPQIERQHLVTLYPQLAHTYWRSSQHSIPWKQLGFPSCALSVLSGHYGIRRFGNTPKERVRAMINLLGKQMPNQARSYLSYLLDQPPLPSFNWTPELKAQSKKLAMPRFRLPYVG